MANTDNQHYLYSGSLHIFISSKIDHDLYTYVNQEVTFNITDSFPINIYLHSYFYNLKFRKLPKNK